MGEMITTPDHCEHYAHNDTDFERLLLTYMGDDAARWYWDRIHVIDKAMDEIAGIVTKAEVQKRLPRSRTVITDYGKLEDLGIKKLAEIAAIALEIAGWDER